MKNIACSTYDRLSKNTFLAILGNKAFKKENSNIYGTKDDEKYSRNKTRAYFEKLNNNSWDITSFDPETRKVCINIRNKGTRINMSVTLPPLI